MTIREPQAQEGGAAAEPAALQVNRRLLEQVLHSHHLLQGMTQLDDIFSYMLFGLPQSLDLPAAELRLLDPEGSLARLLPQSRIDHRSLQLTNDGFALQDLYLAAPQVEVLDLGDQRMFNILQWDKQSEGAVLMPLFASGKLVGSYHWGVDTQFLPEARGDLELLRSLSLNISAAMERTRLQQEALEYTTLDPASGVGNARAHRRYLQREVARAVRFAQPLSLIHAALDNISELQDSHGEAAGQFVIKRVAQRMNSGLRETDSMARIAENRFVLFLPACSEPNGHDIARRMCHDLEEFGIDDGRGGVLHTTVSCGVLTWDPATYPAENPERIMQLMQAEAESALLQSVVAGGNRVSIARLGVLMV